MTVRKYRVAIGIAAFLLGIALAYEAADASVVVAGTRVIYPAGRREVSVGLQNTGTIPSLVQAWIDAGDAKAKPGEGHVPFLLTPPLFRLDPAKGQTLRLIYSQEPLPSDRESVFWLNVLDIPPRAPADAGAANRLEMAFRHRLKLFFRPAGLAGNASDAPGKVSWTVTRQGAGLLLQADNPTPYHISFTAVELVGGGAPVAARSDMLAPFSSERSELPASAVTSAAAFTVRYSFVNDYGAVVSGEAPVHRAP